MLDFNKHQLGQNATNDYDDNRFYGDNPVDAFKQAAEQSFHGGGLEEEENEAEEERKYKW